MDTSLLILSGGLDSTVSAAIAREQTDLRLALFFDYGQRAAEREQSAARAIAKWLEIELQLIALPWLGQLGGSSLTDSARKVPLLVADQLDDATTTEQSAHAVWVPNRNGVFLNVAAAFAESSEAQWIVTGFNAEEAATFPDNSEAFVTVANEFFRFSTQKGVRVISYTQEWNKTEIVREGQKRNVPFELIWSCYQGAPEHCGRCESCQRSMRAYREAGI